MGGMCSCICWWQKEQSDYKGLISAQNIVRTKSGKAINQKVYNRFHSRAELETWKTTLMEKDRHWRVIFKKPINNFTQITDNLYLTGMGGICEENIRGKDIKCLVNVTNELAKYVIEGIESIRIPVEDSPSEDLYPYFTDISNKIEENSKNNKNTVVYCMGGISRSPTLVMAYLMKHKKMHLKEAFFYVLKNRSIKLVEMSLLPNRHFLRSLRQYEKEIYKKNFNQTIDVYTKNRNSVAVPDFALKYYLDTSDTDPDRSDSIETEETIDLKLLPTYKNI